MPIFLLLAGIAHAGRVTHVSPDEVMKLVSEEKLDGLKKVWKELGIESKLFDYRGPEKVERFNEEIDGKDGKESILRISNNAWHWQYLFFPGEGKIGIFWETLTLDFKNIPLLTTRLSKRRRIQAIAKALAPDGWLSPLSRIQAQIYHYMKSIGGTCPAMS